MKDSDLIVDFLDRATIDSMYALLAASDLNDVNANASAVAGAFGPGGLNVADSAEEKRLTASFRKNLSLLIEKTWVEQFDIALKEEVLYRLGRFCDSFAEHKWAEAYGSFIKILNDVVYLMFGSQAKSADFGEYALRIDPEFGIFWWYVSSLPPENDWSEGKNRAVEMVAMFFLANY